ncbi:MAG: hypothetical protein LLF92_01005 [Planctomycetaceae bacterium]|nr:hypothetical protein [Planctomycetaceae bacterium]
MFPVLSKKIFINVVVFLPFIFICSFVYKLGVTIPYYDQWEFIPTLEKMHNHTLTFTDIWVNHSEHKIFFPKLIMLFWASISNWNIALELGTSIVFGLLIFLFLLSLLGNTLKTVPVWLKLFTSLMVFSTIQWQNWLWGWQMAIFMSILGVVIAVWAADKWPGKSAGLAVVISACILSSYSFSSGLLTWPAVFILFLLQRKWKLKHFFILIVSCVTTVLLYYINYHKPAAHPSLTFFLDHPVILIRYILTYLGSSLSWSPSIGWVVTVITFVILLFSIFNIWRFKKEALYAVLPWLILALYSCLAACLTGLGRAGMGWEQASASRYTTISLFLPLSAMILFCYSAKFYHKKGFKIILCVIISIMFLTAYMKTHSAGLKDGEIFSKRLKSATFALSAPAQLVTDFTLKKMYPDPNIARQRIKTLSEIGIKFKNE